GKNRPRAHGDDDGIARDRLAVDFYAADAPGGGNARDFPAPEVGPLRPRRAHQGGGEFGGMDLRGGFRRAEPAIDHHAVRQPIGGGGTGGAARAAVTAVGGEAAVAPRVAELV